jgi:hypothetical protein
MEKKIEKLEGSYDVPQLKQKLNEVIDHLNTQPQAEEETKLVMPPSAYEQAEKEGYDMRKKVKSGLIPESTPEQKEEGSYVLTYKNLKEIMTLMEEQGLNTVSIEYLMQYCGYPIKNLLSERERWAIDAFLKDTASYNSFHNGRPRTMRNGLRGEGFEVRVSKLNKKK